MSMVVVGVGGGVAAFKAATLVRSLTKAGHTVRVIPTEASEHFVGRATWEALSGAPVFSGVFEAGGADHVELARHADMILVAPATADLIARVSVGMANDLLTATILASPAPLLIAPAMHTAMWENPATQHNIATLRERGVHIIGPTHGDLSSGDHGQGRMVEPEDIATAALQILASGGEATLTQDTGTPQEDTVTRDLADLRFVVTAGGTHEAIDPVRFLGNHSTGLQGIAIAKAAAQRGAQVTLIGANIDDSRLQGLSPEVTYVPVVSAQDMHEAVMASLPTTQVLVMAAAVADFRPARVNDSKIKKTDEALAPTITLERTPDILAEVTHSEQRPRVVIGFAAETGTDEQILDYARAKAQRKQADLLVLNRVGGGHGFGNVPNTIDLLTAEGEVVDHAEGSKDHIAHIIVTHTARLIHGQD